MGKRTCRSTCGGKCARLLPALWWHYHPQLHLLSRGVTELVNTIQPYMCGGDAAFCQITLTTQN